MYDDSFYDSHNQWAHVASAAVIPIVFEYIQPKSVVDVGCGEGAWLKSFKAHGVTRVLGVDSAHIDRDRLLITRNEFQPHNLEEPLTLSERFDLAVSLETAEHLTQNAGIALVETLTSASNYILFSAAIPRQGGTGHINEQWPQYWRDVFAQYGFARLDIIRPRIWRDESIRFWFRQNLFFYTNDREMTDVWQDNCSMEIVHSSILRPLSARELLHEVKNVLLNILPG